MQSPVHGSASMVPAMALALDANFGSVARWRDAFAALLASNAGRDGQALLLFRSSDASLHTRWIAHAEQIPRGDMPILAVDANRNEESVDAIDWAPVYQRYQAAVHTASEPFGVGHDDIADSVLLDVRRRGVFEQADAMLPGARWSDPAAVKAWAAELPAGREIVVYCVYGHEVGRATALQLRAAGVNARYLRGGIDGWTAAGRPLQAKGETP